MPCLASFHQRETRPMTTLVV